MSKGPLYLTLGVLLALMGVMSWALRKSTEKPEPPKPSPAQQQAMREQQMKKMKDEMLKRQQEMKKTTEQKKSRPPTTAPAAPAGTMDISDKWFSKLQEGQAGIEKLRKQEARDEKLRQQEKLKTPQTPQLARPTAIAP